MAPQSIVSLSFVFVTSALHGLNFLQLQALLAKNCMTTGKLTLKYFLRFTDFYHAYDKAQDTHVVGKALKSFSKWVVRI